MFRELFESSETDINFHPFDFDLEKLCHHSLTDFGIGSKPPLLNGLHLNKRHKLIKNPHINPCLRNASSA